MDKVVPLSFPVDDHLPKGQSNQQDKQNKTPDNPPVIDPLVSDTLEPVDPALLPTLLAELSLVIQQNKLNLVIELESSPDKVIINIKDLQTKQVIKQLSPEKVRAMLRAKDQQPLHFMDWTV